MLGPTLLSIHKLTYYQRLIAPKPATRSRKIASKGSSITTAHSGIVK